MVEEPEGENEEWLQDPADLEISDEALRAGQRYYDRAIARKETLIVSTPIKLSYYKAEQLKEKALQNATKWEQEGTLEKVRHLYQMEIAFTLFCLQNRKPHPSGEIDLSSRSETLQWITAYLS